MDQAVELREKANKARESRIEDAESTLIPQPVRVIAVTSGKGGVGKTNVTANLAVTLSRRGKKVLIMDADLGLANIDVLLGLKSQYTIEHILTGERTLNEVIIEGPAGVKILPACSGLEKMTNLSEAERMKLLTEFENYEEPIDVLLIDTGAGISPNVMYFTVAAQQILLITTPEPTSITDAYAMMKVLSTRYGENRFLLLPNSVPSERVARKIYQDLSGVAARFLNISIDLIGYIPNDNHVPRAVRNQRAVVELFPDSEASKSFDILADRILATRVPSGPKGNLQFMWRRVLGAN
jgi:flagellar biosynthesis protein FlhG